MCGIIGYAGDFDFHKLKIGRQRLAHRGPDDHGLYQDQQHGIALGHARLAIMDTSASGHQPMVSSEGNVILVFNGEIYNFRALRRKLEKKGYRFRGRSDSEVLLALYQCEGEAMLAMLNGIFALAIWDQRHRLLLIARDALGVKPLYYSEAKEGLAFASEIKALLPLIPKARDLNTEALHRYLSFLWCPGEGTPLQAVRKLLPGEAMVVREGRIARRWAWYHRPSHQSTMGKKEAIATTTTLLQQAVRRQMVADVPVGAFLSGGLDSSAIVAFAREQNPDLRCFTIRMQGGADVGDTEDLPYARQVAKYLDVPLLEVAIDSRHMASDIERMVYMLDEPLADPAPLNVLYISRLAREQGMKVLLSGAGGDDLFSGYRRHVALHYEGLWRWLPRCFRTGLRRMATSLDQRRAWARRLSKLFSGADVDGNEALANYFLWMREAELLTLYSPEFREQLGASRAVTPMLDFLAANTVSNVKGQRMQQMLALEQRFFLGDHNLIYTDKMSMAAGVEVRVPFLDMDLVEFAAQVPARYKQRGNSSKWVLKKAMERYLPHNVIYRPKAGFGGPLRRWMRHELRALLGDYLSVESITRRGIFNPKAVQRLIADNKAGRVDAAYTLLSLLSIEIWCRQFLDNTVDYPTMYGKAA